MVLNLTQQFGQTLLKLSASDISFIIAPSLLTPIGEFSIFWTVNNRQKHLDQPEWKTYNLTFQNDIPRAVVFLVFSGIASSL